MSGFSQKQIRQLLKPHERLLFDIKCILATSGGGGAAGTDYERVVFPPILYEDTSGNQYQLVVVRNYQNNTLDSTDSIWMGASGVLGSAPAGVTPIPARSDSQFEFITLIDDVNSNGSTLVEFVRMIQVSSNGTNNVIGDYETDLITPYTPVGIVTTPVNAGSPAEIKWESLEVANGATWSPTALVRSASYYVFDIGDTNNPPTFTSSSGAVRDLRLSESGTFSLDSEADLTDTAPIITTNAGDEILINYTTL